MWLACIYVLLKESHWANYVLIKGQDNLKDNSRQHYETKGFGQGNPIDGVRDYQKLHMTVFSVRLKLRNVKLLIRFED